MSEMIERVAEASWESKRSQTKGAALWIHPWKKLPPWLKEIERHRARAAIEAMREPTEAMRHSYPPANFGGAFPAREDTWRAMIDAAIGA